MGCQNSKALDPHEQQQPHLQHSKSSKTATSPHKNSRPGQTSTSSFDTVGDKNDRIYKLLVKAQKTPGDVTVKELIIQACSETPEFAHYQNPTTKSTPLHMAVRLMDSVVEVQSSGIGDGSGTGVTVNSMQAVVESLLRAYPDAVLVADADGNIPLHYAIAPTTHFHEALPAGQWETRTAVVNLLLSADMHASETYLRRNDCVYQSGDATGGCTPLYRALQTLPDDFDVASNTVAFVSILHDACSDQVGIGNASDGDKPLALLYRRFTRQFDLAEKFFSGDNSRPDVVNHRRQYKTAAGNTWKIIELLLLRPPGDGSADSNNAGGGPWQLVHRAVQVETPPDLLRYIVETNAEDLTQPDHAGNLPLHYAAKSKPKPHDTKTHFPAFYTKYVVDELLYKFPEAAAVEDADGNFPLTLAVNSGKQWIGGGIKSLYDAHPESLEQIQIEEHKSLKRALSLDVDFEDAGLGIPGGDGSSGVPKEEKVMDGIIQDEQHDAIMLVQQADVDISEVITSMWAHEEDAGVQMLGCVAISRMVGDTENEVGVLRIALSAVAAVVNAMKAHPNEVIVQEKACHALKLLASSDGKREVSFVASGAVAAIVGAMQAHVSDAGVQEEACGAVGKIIHYGGDDRATIVASVSGLTAIVNAVAAHPDAVGVQREGLTALRELTEYPNANLPEMPHSQTEPLLRAAKEKFPSECSEAADVVMSRLSSP
jgi:ankyrin repeat protein